MWRLKPLYYLITLMKYKSLTLITSVSPGVQGWMVVLCTMAEEMTMWVHRLGSRAERGKDGGRRWPGHWRL